MTTGTEINEAIEREINRLHPNSVIPDAFWCDGAQLLDDREAEEEIAAAVERFRELYVTDPVELLSPFICRELQKIYGKD